MVPALVLVDTTKAPFTTPVALNVNTATLALLLMEPPDAAPRVKVSRGVEV